MAIMPRGGGVRRRYGNEAKGGRSVRGNKAEGRRGRKV